MPVESFLAASGTNVPLSLRAEIGAGPGPWPVTSWPVPGCRRDEDFRLRRFECTGTRVCRDGCYDRPALAWNVSLTWSSASSQSRLPGTAHLMCAPSLIGGSGHLLDALGGKLLEHYGVQVHDLLLGLRRGLDGLSAVVNLGAPRTTRSSA
jgi:hypothetical protein